MRNVGAGMSNYYLLFLPRDVISKNVSYDQPRINLNQTRVQLQVDDKIFLVQDAISSILPFTYTVTYVNRSAGTMTLQLEDLYNRVVNWAESFISLDTPHVQARVRLNGTAPLSRGEFEQIVGKMGGKRMEEKALLEHIQSYIRAHGYYFDNETLYNYHICLKVRPFIILAGFLAPANRNSPSSTPKHWGTSRTIYACRCAPTGMTTAIC